MSDSHFDVAVVGLGAMGSAAAYHLASRGVRVLGIDQFGPPHDFGSTHGHTRIIREAYYEHPLYVPLVQRAYELWFELEHAAGRQLYMKLGGLMAGVEHGVLVQGALRSVREHALAHEVLDANGITRRFPAYRPKADWIGVFEPRAGVLFPEACVAAHLHLAAADGATIKLNEPLTEWSADAAGVTLRTKSGTYRAGRMILSTGAWLPQMTNGLALPLVVERQISLWFTPKVADGSCSAPRCPLALWEGTPNHLFATFPDLGQGVKCGAHHEGELTTPQTVNRVVTDEEQEASRSALGEIMPNGAGALREARVCLYTNTPDAHFLIDWHPNAPRVLIASPCSGHGFKFSSAIGEALADLTTSGRGRFDLSPFALSRFG